MSEQDKKMRAEFEASPIIDAFWVRDVLKKMAAERRNEKKGG